MTAEQLIPSDSLKHSADRHREILASRERHRKEQQEKIKYAPLDIEEPKQTQPDQYRPSQQQKKWEPQPSESQR